MRRTGSFDRLGGLLNTLNGLERLVDLAGIIVGLRNHLFGPRGFSLGDNASGYVAMTRWA
jgi:hypothetical protein